MHKPPRKDRETALELITASDQVRELIQADREVPKALRDRQAELNRNLEKPRDDRS